MIKKEDFKNVKFNDLERVYLGGTGRMYRFNLGGVNYLYKPAEMKNTRIKQPFRGYVQECASTVQGIIDKKSKIDCIYVDTDELCGSIQVEIDKLDFRYGVVQDTNEYNFTEEEINQFLREFITDYLLCNFDAHGSNFILGKNGIIYGIDKEQSFRYLNLKEFDMFDLDCNPNDVYGERELIYHYIFRRYIEGNLDIDFNIIEEYISNVERVSDEEYIDIFKDYIEARKHRIDESYLSRLILNRKKYLRNNIYNFINDLQEKRGVKHI